MLESVLVGQGLFLLGCDFSLYVVVSFFSVFEYPDASLDDVRTIWRGVVDDIKQFVTKLGQRHPTDFCLVNLEFFFGKLSHISQ